MSRVPEYPFHSSDIRSDRSAVRTSKAEYKSAKTFTNANWAKRRSRAKNFYGASIEYAPPTLELSIHRDAKNEIETGVSQLDFRDPL